jgi:hypothetical protein
MDLTSFLCELAQDPMLVEEFLDDPEQVMDEHEIPVSLRTLMRSRDDVTILGALLGEGPASSTTPE